MLAVKYTNKRHKVSIFLNRGGTRIFGRRKHYDGI